MRYPPALQQLLRTGGGSPDSLFSREVSFNSTSEQTIVPAVAGLRIWVESIYLSLAANNAFRFWDGPVAGALSLTGLMTSYNVNTDGNALFFMHNCLVTSTGNGLVVQSAAANQISGRVTGWYFT